MSQPPSAPEPPANLPPSAYAARPMERVCLTVSGGIAFAALLKASSHSDGPSFGQVLFVLWVVGPYVVFFVAGHICRQVFSEFPVATWSARFSVLVLVFTAAVYFPDAGRPVSTQGLIFIFGPLWLYVGGPVLGAIMGSVLARRAGRA
jgi:hypothetical protein